MHRYERFFVRLSRHEHRRNATTIHYYNRPFFDGEQNVCDDGYNCATDINMRSTTTTDLWQNIIRNIASSSCALCIHSESVGDDNITVPANYATAAAVTQRETIMLHGLYELSSLRSFFGCAQRNYIIHNNCTLFFIPSLTPVPRGRRNLWSSNAVHRVKNNGFIIYKCT